MEDGICMSTGPTDICLTPAPPPVKSLPLPYPNVAQCAQADASTATSSVTIRQKAVLTKVSKIPKSTGDEPGTDGGVVSLTNTHEVAYITSSTKVKFEGNAVVFLNCNTTQNKANTVGMQTVPSQVVVTVTG